MPLTFEISYKQINNNWLMKLNKIKSAVMILLLAFAVGAKAEEVREVSGTVYTSLIPDNVALKLSGDTKLVVNMDRVITRIEGRTPNLLNPKFNLEISLLISLKEYNSSLLSILDLMLIGCNLSGKSPISSKS